MASSASTATGSADSADSAAATGSGAATGGAGSDGGEDGGKVEESPSRVLLALAFFCASSLGAIFVNKMCLTHFRFAYPSALMLLQSVFTLCFVPLLSYLRPALVVVTPLKRGDLWRVAVPAVLFVANVSVGLSALSLVNIPMFSALRRLTVLFVMGAEFLLLSRRHSPRVVAAVFVLTAGAFVSALGDATFSALGYALVFLNNALTAAYLASVKRALRDLGLDPLSLLFHVTKCAFPFILALSVATGDLRAATIAYLSRTELRASPLFVPTLVFVAGSAFCVNLSTALCTHVTSPLTTAVAGQVKNVLQTVLGFFSWGYTPTALNVSGLLVALLGQLAFARFKFLEAARPAADDAPPAAPSSKDLV